MDILKNKILGSYYGSIIGDQIGQILEFKPKESQYYRNYNEMILGMKEGVWTDDTSMMLCLIKTLSKKNKMDKKDLLDNFYNWFSTGYLTVHNNTFDCGFTVSERLHHYNDTKELDSPFNTDNKSGNGSLMRIAPIAYHYYNDYMILKQETTNCSITTHSSRKAIDSCILQTNLIAQILNGLKKEYLVNMFKNDLEENVNIIFEKRYEKIESNIFGYVIDSLAIALHSFFTTDDFNNGLFKTINYGGDTDTNAAIYGQLAGAYYGYEKLDKNFLELIVFQIQLI